MAGSDVISSFVYMLSVNPLSANHTEWLNKLKQLKLVKEGTLDLLDPGFF